MGCKQSKGIESAQDNGMKRKLTSPMSAGSFGEVSLPSEISKMKDPGEKLHRMLMMSLEQEDMFIWAKIMKICDADPNAASYFHPETLDTPLHLLCKVMEISPVQKDGITASPIDAARMLIRCCPDCVTTTDADGYIPLHYAIRPTIIDKERDDSYIYHQAGLLRILIAADYEISLDYLQRNDVVFEDNGVGCTPLYHACSALPDDFSNTPGPTVDIISAIHFPKPQMVSMENLSNHDKSLGLLYRRFSRQFDISEKFFPGDNSHKDILEFRNKYKAAAMNTWKIILTLLDPIADNKKRSVSEFYLVHAAIQVDCPPDLLRYIIETRKDEVRKIDDDGNLPLHLAAASIQRDIVSTYHFKYVIDELLYSYPDGAATQDKNSKLPLQLAMESGKSWIGGGVKSLHDIYPDAMQAVQMENFPTIKKAISFSSNFIEEQADDGDDENDTTLGKGAASKEEHYDAIMLVQNPDANFADTISAMWANEEDGGVQMLGCIAITDIAKKYAVEDEARLLDLALTAVTTIVNAMKNHPNEPAVQEKACIALTTLSPADNYREVSFAASGAAASIVCAMQAHVSDAIVQQVGCRALQSIVKYGGSERATVIASVSGFTTIQNALGAHPDVLEVQQEACLVLEALTSFPDANLPALPGVQIAPLLEDVTEKYPQFKEIAQTVLSRLS